MDKPSNFFQNVIAMTDFRLATGYSALSQVEAYWHALCGNRQMPKRSEIDPRGIEAALESTFIVERIAPGVARLRVAGSALNDLMGMEVRGMPITAFFRPSERRAVSDVMEDVFQRPSICKFRLTSPAEAGSPSLEARMILMPLKSDLGDASRVLGCLVCAGPIGHAPRRFDITNQQVLGINGAAIAPDIPATNPRVDASSAPITPTKGPGFAAPTTEFQTAQDTSRTPYLRLVKSDTEAP